MPLLKFDFSPNLSPPERYTHRLPNGVEVKADDRAEWLREIKKKYDDNNIPLAEGWEADVEDKLCRVLPPGWCKYDDGGKPQTYLNVRFALGDLARGTQILVDIMSHPDPLVDEEEANRRAKICSSCQANVNVSGCMGCVPIADLVSKVRGAKQTKADSVLRHCAVCRCALRAMVWVKEELLEPTITAEQREQYSLLPWCWKASLQNPSQP